MPKTLRELRGGMSQAKLAERLGVSQVFISKMERGTKAPGRALIKRMSEELQVPLDDLYAMWDDSKNEETPAGRPA